MIIESGFVVARCDEDVKVKMPLKLRQGVGIDRPVVAVLLQGDTQIQIKCRCKSIKLGDENV